MVREVKWTKYLWLSLLLFGAFMLEYPSIFFIGVLLPFSRKHYHFPVRGSKGDKISPKSWIVTLACFIGCKIMAFIDWHTLKIVGEAVIYYNFPSAAKQQRA